MTSRSDLDRFGFDRKEITSLLAKNGIHIEADSEAVDYAPVQSFPEWKQAMSLHSVLSEKDAAYAFAGIDPYQSGYLSDGEWAEHSRWTDLIVAEIAAGNLVASEKSADPDGTRHWAIRPADLAAWCASKVIAFPLPSAIETPATDAGLRDALAATQADCARWKVKAESLATHADKIKIMQSEIDNLRRDLRENAETISKLTTERDAQKLDLLSGKSKTKTLEIIGGMAIKGYGIDIHGSTLNRIGEIVKDLQMVGVSVTEKTLRTYLQDASNLIDKQTMK